MPFLEHLEELRWRLVWSLGALVVGVGVSFYFLFTNDDFILHFLAAPIQPVPGQREADLHASGGGLQGDHEPVAAAGNHSRLTGYRVAPLGVPLPGALFAREEGRHSHPDDGGPPVPRRLRPVVVRHPPAHAQGLRRHPVGVVAADDRRHRILRVCDGHVGRAGRRVRAADGDPAAVAARDRDADDAAPVPSLRDRRLDRVRRVHHAGAGSDEPPPDGRAAVRACTN